METEKVKCPECGKEFKKFGLGPHIFRSHTEKGKNFKPYKDGKPWNKGLTKETSKSIKKSSETLKARFKSGELIQTWKGKKYTEERRKNLSEIKKEQLKDYDYAQKLIMNFKNSKSGWYEDYWCDSSYELAFVIYNLEHNIKFERNKQGFEYLFEDVIRKYFPDFILEDGTYVEIKGRDSFDKVDEQTKQKIIQFKEPLKVLYNEDMKIYLNYVKEKYGKDFISLYKDYKKPEKILKPLTEFQINQLSLIEERKKLILNSGIDFTKYGWVNHIVNLMGVKFNCHKFMKKHLLEFYTTKCFIRK